MAKNERLAVSIGTEYDEQLRLSAEAEHTAYLQTREPPEHFMRVGEWLRIQVRTGSDFYQQHRGKYVAVLSLDPPVMEIDPDVNELLKRVYERWGYRPIHTLQMDVSVLRPTMMHSPRTTRR